MFTKSINHTKNAGDDTKDNNDLAKQDRGWRQQEVETDDTVDAHLDHYAGHDSRDMAWCGWMSIGQPDMERHNTCLGAAAD